MTSSPSKLHTTIAFGLVGGALFAALRLVEYRYLIVEHSLEVYAAFIAAIFAGVGIWLGTSIVRTREVIREIAVHVEVPVKVPVEVRVPADAPFVRDQQQLDALRITEREVEVLGLIAQGLSTREMAGQIHVSENTIKTHASRVFAKLGARRRTQAVQLGKVHRLIP
jgi:DNA-binding NarL/FixJ family response regulator